MSRDPVEEEEQQRRQKKKKKLMKTTSHMVFFHLVLYLVQAAIVTSHALPFNSSSLTSAPFLKDILKSISRRERWDLDAVRVSEVEERSARFGRSRRYEFRIRVAKTVLDFRFLDDVVSWKKLRRLGVSLPDLISGHVDLKPKRLTLGVFKLEGPLELHVGGDDQLSLLLPLNTTHSGLKRVHVGEGITIKVEGAREASLIDPLNFGLLSNQSLVNEDRGHYLRYGYSPCASLLSVNIVGSASLVAYKTHSNKAYILTAAHSHDTIELLSEKCYNNDSHLKQRKPSFSILSLDSRLNLLRKLLRSFLGHRSVQDGSLRFLKAKVTSLALVKFRLEVERDIGDKDRVWSKVADWKTKPAVERTRFEIVARIEGAGGEMKPVGVKKLMRPFVAVDSTAWSSLMSNISFTQFSSLVSPEALTLDVKW